MPTVSPVMYVAWSEQRNATVFATSSGAPARRRGMDLARLSADSRPFARRSISASSRIRVPTMRPGATALTRTPCSPTSVASVWVSATIANFDAQYAPCWATPDLPIHEAMFTTTPERRSTIPGTTARVTWNGPSTFTRNVSLQCDMKQFAAAQDAGVVDENVDASQLRCQQC